MKKIFSTILAIVIMSAALPVSAVRGYRSLWIECETAYKTISGDYASSGDGNASGSAALKLDSTNDKDVHEAAIYFTLSYDNTYDIYILGTPGASDWASKHTWSIDNGEFTTDAGATICNAYNTGDARNAGISWHKLTTMSLKRGSHQLNFKTSGHRAMGGFCYSVFDVIAIVPSSWEWQPNSSMIRPYDKNAISIKYADGSIQETVANAGDTVHATVKNRIAKRTDANLQVYAELRYNGETVVKDAKHSSIPTSNWIQGKAYSNDFALKLPFNAPDGVYEVVAGVDGIDYTGENPTEVIGTIVVGDTNKEEIVPYKVNITDVSAPEAITKDTEFTVSFKTDISKVLDEKSTVYVSLWKDNLLYTVMETGTSVKQSGDVTVKVRYTDDLPDGEYTIIPGVHNYENTVQGIKVRTTGADSIRSNYHKPMSYGNYYAEKNGKTHFWYIDQTGTNIFNGEPYIPMGGMFVSTYITGYVEGNDEGNQKNFEQDKADLELLRAAGVKDLYINPVGGSRPVWAWQYLLDYLEETGWRYGIQMGIVQSREADTFYPKATENSGWIKLEGIKKNGTVTLEQEVYTRSIFDYFGSVYIVINDATGELVDSGIGELRGGEKGLVSTANIKNITNGESNTVYFAPRVYSDISKGVNFWDVEAEVLEKTESFFSKFQCGSGLRLVVDPMGNESGLYNSAEMTRFTGEEFDGRYQGWLEEKYGTVQKLTEAWKPDKPIPDFATASRLVPVYTENRDETDNYYTYYVDNKTGKGWKFNSRSGTAWNDYLDGRDDLYLEAMNKQADVIKKHMDLPVVHKHCSVQRRYYINKQLEGGLDALGAEAYGHQEGAMQKAVFAVAQTKQFARTAWVITTETNNNENVMGKYESGQWGYESAEIMEKHFDAQFNIGIKGIYDFLLADRIDIGGALGLAYSHVTNPDNLSYLSQYIKKVETPEFRERVSQNTYLEEVFYFYPSQKNWWHNPTERTVVQFEDDNARVQRLNTENGTVVMQTDDPGVDTRILFINLNNGPYSNIFGPKLTEEINKNKGDKKFVFFGHRNDLGTLDIDKFYSDRKVTVSDGTVIQPLIPDERCEIIAQTENGDVWAMKRDNLYFMSTSDLFSIDGEFYKLKHVDSLGITE